MKILGVLAMTAALVATGVSAQGASERANVRQPEFAKERIAKPRGSNAFASAPATRLPAARTRAGSGAFDGNWSVLIQTQSGECDRAYRYGVQIQNGEIFNSGGEPIALEGRVAPSGAVRVSVGAGGQEARGAGRLSRTSGSGSWRGQGSRGACAGTWVAERRD
jgi:hypothetical protein